MKKKAESDNLNELQVPMEPEWANNADTIKQFSSQIGRYEDLASEVAFILTTYTENELISVSNITHRAKEFDSFIEKCERKGYADPFNEVTDLAGVRVIVYYEDELEKVVAIIRRSFEVIDVTDRSQLAGVDRFGYGGIHLVVKLNADHSGARYDHIKDLICEIQLRTVMQDAWATLSHKLMYKRESDTPAKLRRIVNALAGAMDSADFSFRMIRDMREEYTREVESLQGTDAYLDVELDQDSFQNYLVNKFPDLPLQFEGGAPSIDNFLAVVRTAGLRTLGDLEAVLNETKFARERLGGEGVTRARSALAEVYIAIRMKYGHS